MKNDESWAILRPLFLGGMRYFVNNQIIFEIKDLKTYFYTYEGVAKAVDGVSYQPGQGRALRCGG